MVVQPRIVERIALSYPEFAGESKAKFAATLLCGADRAKSFPLTVQCIT